VQYGGVPIRTSPLTTKQHLLCVGIGMFSWVQGLLIKALLPAAWFEWLHFKEDRMTDEEEKASVVTSFRRSFRQSLAKSASKQSSRIEGKVHTK
jgi:hypothetical protein